MARRTSAVVYRQIKASGLLQRQRWRIYRELYKYGPMTATECFKRIEAGGVKINYNTRTRFGELRDRGALYEVGTRPCKVTGRTVIEWDVSGQLPSPSLPKQVALPSSKKLAQVLEDFFIDWSMTKPYHKKHCPGAGCSWCETKKILGIR